MEKTNVTHVQDGFECRGVLLARHLTGTGEWAPRRRLPTRAMEKGRDKLRAALAPEAHRGSARTTSAALKRILRRVVALVPHAFSPEPGLP